MVFEIKRWDNDKVIFTSETAKDFKEAVEEAVKKRVNLHKAYLSGAYLLGADLSGAHLLGADLSRCNLSEAYLLGADLSGAYLLGADLSGADLTGADLTGADLTGADLSGADHFRCKIDKKTLDYLVKEWLEWEVTE